MPADDTTGRIREEALRNPALYGDAFADVYDAWYHDLNDGDFVAAVSRRLPGRPCSVLELGVGTGRLVLALAARRAPVVDTVTGVDSSSRMLEAATERGVDAVASLVAADFSRDMPDGPFDAVFVGYNTLFNLVDTDAISRCFGLVAERLAEGGFFMVDAVIPSGTGSTDHTEVRTMANGDVVRSTSSHDPVTQSIAGYFSHLTDGHETAHRPWFVHYLTPAQLDSLAQAAGLECESRWADGHGTPFTASCSRHVTTYVKHREHDGPRVG